MNGFLLNWGGRVPFGASITYHCNEGFDVVGSNILTCQSDGTWDTPPPRCGRSIYFSFYILSSVMQKYLVKGIFIVASACTSCAVGLPVCLFVCLYVCLSPR